MKVTIKILYVISGYKYRTIAGNWKLQRSDVRKILASYSAKSQ